ncbi:MAG: HYR domain-containing protein, partial [Bacteroidetes bacterium]
YLWGPAGQTTQSINGLSVGTYTLNVTDANGCTDALSGNVIQDDSQPPAALCQDATVYLTPSGTATISATAVNAGSTDNCGIASLVVSPNVFTCAEVGPNPVTLTVTDVNGNTATCNATVSVLDTVAPTAVCQDLTVTLDANGTATVSIAEVDNGSFDNCGVQNITLSPNSFSCSDLGANTVQLQVTDFGGNTSFCNATVTVVEDTDPQAVCQDITVSLGASGTVSVNGSQVGSGSTDNCGVADITVSPADFTCADIGINPVTVNVVDANGNTASCTANVTVVDDLAPSAVCQDVSVYLDQNGSAAVSVAQVDGGSSDNCAIAGLSASPTDFDCADLGPQSVQLTVTDVNGNQSLCTATVTVVDTLAPTAICQDVTVQLDQNGAATVLAADVDNGSFDNCGSVTVSISPNSFDCTVSSPGQVELTVTDAAGNSSTCSATVNLLENTPPTAVCQDATVQLDEFGNASISATDVDGGSFDNCGIADLSVNPATFDCSNLGENTVTLTATDASGNSSVCTATVTVQDVLPPVAVCQDISIQLDANGLASVSANAVNNGSTDNCGISNISVSPNEFNCQSLGITPVTLTVTDINGNSSTCTANVDVLDTIPPTAICEDVTVELDIDGNATITANQVNNGSADACGVATITLDNTNFDCTQLGVNVVELTVTDNNGNASTCAANVTVVDVTDPAAVCQSITVYLDESGEVTVSAIDVDAGSTDNCAVADLQLSQTAFTCSDLGQGFVTLTVSDASGNADDCVAVLTIVDTVAPAITGCPADITVVPESSDCSPMVVWTEPAAADNCSATMSSNFTSGDDFPVGSTTVTYTAIDPSGNTTTCTFIVTVVPSEVMVSLSSPQFACGYNISCNGADDGQATATVSGGCEPYQFVWSGGQTTQTATNLSAGQQILTVTDANGTQVTDTIVLTEPTMLTIDSLSVLQYTGGSNVSCPEANDGGIELAVSGGASCVAYDFQWSGPAGFVSGEKDIVDLAAGSYTVVVTDANGCSLSQTTQLIAPDPIQLQSFPTTYNGFNISCFGLADGFINLEVASGVPPYDYAWSNGQSTQDIGQLIAGNYTVVVTDANGCEATLSEELIQPTQLDVQPTDTIPVNCAGGSDGQFSVLVTGGVPGYNYAWSNGDTDAVLNAIGAGTYQVVVSDNNGCQDSISLVMVAPDSIAVQVLSVVDATCFGDDDGSATIQATGGVGPYSYLWPSVAQTGQTATELDAGQYIFEVTDANGCEVSGVVEVSSPAVVTLLTSNDTTICPNTPVTLFAEASGGGGTYLITWENGEGFGQSFQTFITQTENISVIAVDQNGCSSAPNSVIVQTYNDVIADFDFNVVDQCTVPATTEFTNNSTNASTFSWSFGNGESSNQFQPSMSYDSAGVYPVTLTVVSTDGCSDSVTAPVTIFPLPQAGFNIPFPDGCYPILVPFYQQSSGANTYFWDFGDGQTSDEPNPFHFYEEPGAYTVSLIVTSQFGCTDTLTVDTAVYAYPQPTADFIPIMLSAPEPGSEFTFINNSQGASGYLWNFGSGDFSELFEPIYDYPEHGTYTIVLRAYNEFGCVDTATAAVTVELTSGLFVPNAVAIGEPGEAGVFLPKGDGLGQYHVWVFDLWGNLLWESTELVDGSPAEAWDGRYKGRLVPQGSYTWKVEATFKDGIPWEGMEQPFGKSKTVGSVTVLY